MNYLLRNVLALFASLASASAVAQDSDTQAWEVARANDTREAYEAYLTAHPAGRFSRDALLAIVQEVGNQPTTTETRGGAIVPAAGQDGGFIPVLY